MSGDVKAHLGMRRYPPLAAFGLSILCQAAGFGVGFAAARFSHSLWLFVFVYTLAAFGCARFIGLSLPWQAFNIITPPAILASQALAVDSALFAGIATVILIGALLTYIPTFWTRVPFYPTSNEMYSVIASELPADKPFTFIDLGSGFGSLIAYLRKVRPQGTFYGIEISPFPYMISRLRFLSAPQTSVRTMLGSFWKLPLSNYDYVYAFLSPDPMARLWEKVRTEMKRGACFLTNTFEVAGTPTRVHKVEDKRKCTLYIHKL